jgi:hypothetical protein
MAYNVPAMTVHWWTVRLVFPKAMLTSRGMAPPAAGRHAHESRHGTARIFCDDALSRSQILILGVTSVLAELPVLAVYAALAGRASQYAPGRRFARAVDFVAGALLIAAALGIALGR